MIGREPLQRLQAVVDNLMGTGRASDGTCNLMVLFETTPAEWSLIGGKGGGGGIMREQTRGSFTMAASPRPSLPSACLASSPKISSDSASQGHTADARNSISLGHCNPEGEGGGIVC